MAAKTSPVGTLVPNWMDAVLIGTAALLVVCTPKMCRGLILNGTVVTLRFHERQDCGLGTVSLSRPRVGFSINYRALDLTANCGWDQRRFNVSVAQLAR